MTIFNISDLFSSLFSTSKKEDVNMFSLLNKIGASNEAMADLEA